MLAMASLLYPFAHSSAFIAAVIMNGMPAESGFGAG